MRFLEPMYLGLLPIALLGVWWMGRRMLGMSRARKRLVLALRFIVITLLILALAAPQAVQSNRGVCVIFALDLSDSISDRGRQAANEYLKEAIRHLGEHDVAGLVVFGRDALVDFMPAELRELPTIYSKPEPDGTNIAAALRLASAMFPDGKNKRIVLLSDGNETEGSAQDAALVAATENIEIDVVQLAAATPDSETLVLETQAPSEVKIGEPFNMRVVIESRKAAEGTLVIDRDGEPVKRVPVKLAPGKNVVVVPVKTEREGFHRYRVSLEASPDGDARNNIGRAFVRVRGTPRVLLAEGGSPDPTRALEKALRANNLEVTRVNASTFPARAEDLQNYEAILLHDFPAVALSPQMMLALQSAVRDTGIGFAMIGGENSFLPGGYYETPIAEMLPVDLDVRQRKIFPPATVVIIVDISGSMSVEEDGIPKIQLAAKAAIETLKLLRPQDQFGVIVSGTGVDWLAPISKASNRDAVIAQVSRMYAEGGGIYVRPSLEFAENALTPITTTTRHVILLADGDDCDEQEGCFQIAARMRRVGITMSVVSLGRGKDVEFLKQLARVSGGNFYLTERARDLPRLFTADVALMTRSAIEEGAFIPKVSAGEEMLQGINWRSTPPLLAYDLVSDRPLARTLMRTHKDDPLLAVWQYGLGQSLAFTSDAKPRWAQRWVGWSEFAPFWTQLTRSILRKGGKQDYQTTVRLEGGQAVVEMQAFTPQGEPINFLQPEVRVGMPTGEGLTITLQQEAPGRYVGRFPARGVGDYTLTVVEKDPDGTVRTNTTGFAIPYPSEYRFTRANLPLLTRIAETTGGKVNPQPTEAFRPVAREGRSVRDLWRTFLWLALALLLMDITLRRVVIPISEWLELLRRVPEKLLGGTRARRPAPQAQATARLLGVKERAGTRRAEPDGATAQPKPTPATASAPVSETESTTASPKQPTQPATPTDTTTRLLEIKKQRRR
jgi:uncharacterized membrane protein